MTDTQPNKQDWIATYSPRILKEYSKWQSPLGVSQSYIHHVIQYLDKYFDDPLKRTLIEKTYQA